MTPLHLHGTLSIPDLGDVSYDLKQLPLDEHSWGSSTLHAKVILTCSGDASGRHLGFFLKIGDGRDPAMGPHPEVRFRAEQCMTACVFEDKGFRYWFEDRFRELASPMAHGRRA